MVGVEHETVMQHRIGSFAQNGLADGIFCQIGQFHFQPLRQIEDVDDLKFAHLPVAVRAARGHQKHAAGADLIFSGFRQMDTRSGANQHQFEEIMFVNNFRCTEILP